jgi:hypothetical protein
MGDLVAVLIVLVLLVAIGWAAHYIIGTFIPIQMRTPAMFVVGVILLIILLVILLRWAGVPTGRGLG